MCWVTPMQQCRDAAGDRSVWTQLNIRCGGKRCDRWPPVARVAVGFWWNPFGLFHGSFSVLCCDGRTRPDGSRLLAGHVGLSV